MDHDKLLKELDELHIEYHDETTFGDYTIKVEPDFDPQNPRKDWDPLGTMVCFHSRYDLGDDHGYSNPNNFIHCLSGLYEDELTDYLSDEELQKCWEEANKTHVILPLYLYDHSGITMRTSSFHDEWDSGQVGWIYMSHEQMRKEYLWERITQKRINMVAKYLEGEVETYDHYLTGSVYGYTIEKGEDEEHVDSCWGFFGYYTDDDGYMISQIKDAIKYDIEHTPQQREMPITQSSQQEMHV